MWSAATRRSFGVVNEAGKSSCEIYARQRSCMTAVAAGLMYALYHIQACLPVEHGRLSKEKTCAPARQAGDGGDER